MSTQPIGIFDSGYGGLTVFKSITKRLPGYDYIYLGDNKRAPYGNRSFETVYEYTLQCVEWLFSMGCPIVILACNTASAKALRTIQENDLKRHPGKKVLGVIRPTAEVIGQFTMTKHVGVLGTIGTVNSESYPAEIKNFYPELEVYQQACPTLVHMIENNEHHTEACDALVKKYINELMDKCSDIDTVLLACTHYPLLMDTFKKYLPEDVQVVQQGNIVAESLADYLLRHPEVEQQITKGEATHFYTTDSTTDFNEHATRFFGKEVKSEHLVISDASCL
jgi:glutamate racemase